MASRLAAAVLALCAAAQLALFGMSQGPKLARAPERLDTFLADDPPVPINPQIQAYRSLPAVAERIPRNARTLLVTPHLDFTNYELYFVPRPFRLLRRCPPNAVEFVRAHAPEHAAKFEERYRQMLERRLVLTPQRLAADLAWCEFLVVFAPGELASGELALPQRAELVLHHRQAALYRLAPR
jgi:hypothetical protein